MSKQIGGAKGGGQGGSTAARTPIIQADSVRSKSMIEVVEAWGWGQIEGFATADPLQSIKLDGTPIKSPDGTLNFQGISIDYRLGTQDQAYIPGTLEDAIGSPVAVNTPVIFSTPITKTINDATTDAVRVIVTYASLMSQNVMNGDRGSVTVELKIEVRPAGATTWVTADLQGRGIVRDKIESPYQRAFTINLKAIDSIATAYDIRVSRVSPDPVSNASVSEQSAFQWDSYVKLTYAKLRRPNIPHIRLLFDARYFSSVPVRSYDLKGMLIKVPPTSVYNPNTREYTTAVWDGSLVMSFCRCPAWILYHILTTGGIGLGAEINQAYQDKWSIFTIAKRCDEKVPDGAGGQECRYSLDAQFMTQVSAHELVNQIAGTFDAMPLWDGKSVYLTQDAPKAVSSLYCPANVLNGRFVYQGSARQTRYTAALIQYNDLTDQSRLSTEYVEDFSAIDRYGYRPTTETAIGCTSRAQAHRRGKRLLITGRSETDAVTFSVGLSGINNKPGDIIRIADPLKSKGIRLGGRLATGSTKTVIKLDSPVILDSGKSYKLAIVGNDGIIVESPISTAAGTVSTVTVSNAFPAIPEAELEFIIYVQSEVARLFRILGITENDDPQEGFYTISATQYSATKFADIDSIADLTPLPVNPYQINSVAPPSGILVNEGVYTGIEGLIRYLDISWSASNDMLLRGYHLIYRHNGVTLFDSEITGQTYRIVNPLAGTYEITVSSVAVTGRYSTSVTVTHILGELYPIESVSVTNLVLKGNTGTTFSGKQPEFTWDTDALAVLGFSTTYAVGAGGQSPWFRDFQIDIYNPDDATIPAPIIRTEFVTESAYVYTFEKNELDGTHRRVKAIVRARDNYGRYSAGMSLTVNNPAPTAINPLSVSIFAGYKSLIIKYTRPADNDWLGVIVFVSTVLGFTPSVSNRVFSGTDLSVVVPNLAEGTYFIRLAAYDAFGSETDYVLTNDEFTKAVGNLDATSLFTWLKYADTPTTGMTDTSTGKSYIGIAYNKSTMTESSVYADYEWSKFAGTNGTNGTNGINGSAGTNGTNGTNGASLFTWLKYADTATTGMSDLPAGKTYMGVAYNKTSATESSVYADYAWSLIKATDGINGVDGTSTFTWVKYGTNSSGAGINDSPTGCTYIGFAFNKSTATESVTPVDYTWSLIKGADGTNGINGSAGTNGTNGTNGANGASLFTWLKYADTATTGMSDLPAGKTYMGVAYNKTSATESSVYADYAWSLIKATDGINGVDGTSTFTWVKYGTNSSGAGINDSPTGCTYIGFAFNKSTATESTTTTDYTWSLIKGTDGTNGTNGANGQIGLPGKDGFVFNPVVNADFAGGILPTGFTFSGTIAGNDFDTTTRLTNTVADQWLLTYGDFIPGDGYMIIIRVKWVAGAWEGVLYYGNTTHGASGTANQFITIPTPIFNEWTLITIDARTLTADYMTGGNLSSLRFDFINNVGASVVLDYIMVGKYGIPSLSGVDIKTKLQSVINDPTVTPLTFNADAFVINVNGVEKPPFILGNIAGAPALLLDADVSVTGALSASQITSGNIAATETLTIGNGSMLIDGGSTGDASIIVYKGSDIIVNRDLAILSSGDLSFMKYREGAYRTYKNVQRVVYGVAESGTTVTIDGWWDAQPIIQVSTYALTSYLKAYGAQDQSWQIRADNLREVASTTVGVITQQGLALIGSAETKNNTGYVSNIGSSTGGKQAYAGNTTTEDCYMEFKFDSKPCSIGFSIGASNAAVDTIKYVMTLEADSSLTMKANGVTLLSGGIYPLTFVWKIYRIGAEINFVRVFNGETSFRKAAIPVGEAISVDSYLGAGSAISGIKFWKRLPPAPSGKWQFDAVADLTLSNSAGNTVVTSQSGATSVNTWTSGESALIANTVSATVAVQFSSTQGNGTSTYGYYYRTVTWTIQGWNGSAWVSLAAKTRVLTAAEHGVAVVDDNAVNITAAYTKIRVYFSAANTNGSVYSLAGDVYNYQEVSKDITGGADDWGNSANVRTSGPTSLTYDLGNVTPSSGFNIYEVSYSTNWTLFANSSQAACTFGISSTGFSRNSQAGATLKGTLSASSSSYDRYFWKAAISGYGTCYGNCNTLHATVKSRQLIVNSSAVSNNFTFSSYGWSVVGSTVLAKGSLNYIAVGS